MMMIAQDVLDLRGLPVWERATSVLARVDELGEERTLMFLTDIDPRALLARIEELRPGQGVFESRQHGAGNWQVCFTRVNFDETASSLDAALRRSPIFGVLDDPERGLLVDAASERTARKGETIRRENQTVDSLGIVLDGTLAVFVGAGSRERLIFHLAPFETFGEIELLDGGLSMGRIVGLSKNVRYVLFPRDTLHDLMMRKPQFLAALASIAAQRNRALTGALAAHVSRPILARIAEVLLAFAAPERGLHPSLAPLPTMTQAQVAAAAGTVKEVAARAIADLERLGALRRERGHIRYLDRSKLLDTIAQAR